MLNAIKRLLRRTSERVYCQYCGKDITDKGALVGQSSTYCSDNTLPSCSVKNLLLHAGSSPEGEVRIYNYYLPRKVQKAISRGRITKFGKLEKSASS
ncbi:hypothetical protein HYW76_04410 [Candidatus Pacearchaeota archaeon]|nr:hypothetical protein [Candidatus Pacearchaeota archaeon]